MLTLNTHSLVEKNYIRKLADFVDAISLEKPDVIALQEVNQTCCEAEVPAKELSGYCTCHDGVVIRKDNHVWNAVKQLQDKGETYYWTWLPMKKGYDKYDEGIALMSRSPIRKTDVVQVSEVDDYNNWKTRKLLGICTEALPEEWFYSVHYGWWNDAEEPFQGQWEKTNSHMKKKEAVWLMGDFNSPAEVRKEGYDQITTAGWMDSFLLASRADNGITVGEVIDGWKEKITDTNGMRIDQIWCKRREKVTRSQVIFNGRNYPVVSDHYGVMIEYER